MDRAARFDVRATSPDEHRAAHDTMRTALLMGPSTDEDWTSARESWEDVVSFTAWDGPRCVGHAGAFRFDTVVPGGARVPTAGVTRVGVLPTATRQGLLSRMMRELLLAARAEGRPLASLRASEAVIYGRFGFGIAADAASITLDTRRARPLLGAAPGSVRLLDRAEILDVVPPLYDRIIARPGAITRPMPLWRRYLADALDGGKASFVVVHTGPDGADDGFAHYSLSWSEAADDEAFGLGEVHDVWGASPGVEVALWEHLVGIDLVRSYTVEERPLDDVLRPAVRDVRAYRTRLRYDEQWVRLLDVEAALSARRYRPGPPITIDVHDPWFPENSATFEIADDGDVRRSAVTADLSRDHSRDLSCDVSVLGAVYLGTTPWHELAAVGRVSGSPDAVARADDRFAARPQAFCGSFF